MSTDLICPDCGGVIGLDPSDPGRACTCYTNTAPARSSSGTDNGSSGDTVVERAAGPVAKVCCQCGVDLHGKKRLNDSRGYWCYACHKLDQEANKPKGQKCADCGRIVPPAALSDYNGDMICGACRNDRKEQAKHARKVGGVDTSSYDQDAKKKLLIMLGVVAALGLIIILKQLHII